MQTDIDQRYLMTAPPNGHVWHKAFFWWVRVQGHSPHAPGISKNAYGLSAFPLLVVPQAPGDEPNPNTPKGVKAWRETP